MTSTVAQAVPARIHIHRPLPWHPGAAAWQPHLELPVQEHHTPTGSSRLQVGKPAEEGGIGSLKRAADSRALIHCGVHPQTQGVSRIECGELHWWEGDTVGLWLGSLDSHEQFSSKLPCRAAKP